MGKPGQGGRKLFAGAKQKGEQKQARSPSKGSDSRVGGSDVRSSPASASGSFNSTPGRGSTVQLSSKVTSMRVSVHQHVRATLGVPA